MGGWQCSRLRHGRGGLEAVRSALTSAQQGQMNRVHFYSPTCAAVQHIAISNRLVKSSQHQQLLIARRRVVPTAGQCGEIGADVKPGSVLWCLK